MKKDIPIQAGTPNVVTGVPEIKMTTGDFTKQWTDIFTKMAKDVYAIGNQFLEVDREIEENKEFMDVNQKILEKRKLYSDEFENPEKIDLNNAEWRSQRDEALKKLREEEFLIIRNSRINNISKDKFADTSNTYYMEKSVKNNMVYGEFTRQNNLSRATNNIIDSIELIGQTDNESERAGLVNSINNSRGILIKYGVPEADVNANIMKNLRESLTIASKNEIDNLFNSYDPDVAYIKAQELIGLNAQKYTALLGKVDGIKEEKAEEILKNYYNEQKDIFSGYINDTRKNIKRRLETENKIKKEYYNRDIEDALYNRDPYTLLWVESGKNKKYTLEEALSDDGQFLKKVTDYTMDEFGDLENGIVFPFLTPKALRSLNNDIAARKATGRYSYDECFQPIYDFANSVSGNSNVKRNAIIADYALRNKIDPTILINGENNPEYFRIGNLMKEGNDIENQVAFTKQMLSINLNGKATSNLEKLAKEFSSNEVLGNYLAINYILGYAKVNNRIDRLLERPDIELNIMLSNKNLMSTFKQDIKIAAEFTSQRRDYKYVDLIDPRVPREEKTQPVQPKVITENENSNKKVNSLFGGRK